MSHLSLTLFGQFQVQMSEQPLTNFKSDKVRALLCYLAVEPAGVAHSRNSLAALLWPGYSDESAHTNLRQTLYHLRKLLADENDEPDKTSFLFVTRHTITFNPVANCEVDVRRFYALLAACAAHEHRDLAHCATCQQRLRQAVDLYQGEFLAGFTIDDSDAFEEWRRITQEQLHGQALTALTQLADAAEAVADFPESQYYAERQLILEPWREEAYRQIMRVLVRSGQRTAALAQYQRCRQILQSGLGVEPDTETTALFEQIRRGAFDKAARWQDAGATLGNPPHVSDEKLKNSTRSAIGQEAQERIYPIVPSPLHDWGEMPAVEQLEGRTVELAQLAEWLGAGATTNAAQQCRLVTVLGMGGTGKTTLSAAITKAVAPTFDTVIWRSLLNAPPLAEVLADWLQILARETLFTLHGSLAEQLRLLLDYLRRQRCLLVLDNLETILQPNATGALRPGYEGYGQLLQQVGGSEHQSVLLLTSREQPQVLTRLLGQNSAVRILPLAGLDSAAGYALLHAYGLPASTADAHALVTHYSGNPLALQLVAQTIQELFGGATPAFLAEGPPIFEDIRTVLDQQYSRLSALEQELLLWLAIEREAVTLPMLRDNLVHPPLVHVLVEAVRSLQRRSLLEKSGDGFTLQNVVMEYTTEYFVAQVCEEILAFSVCCLDVETDKLEAKIQNLLLNRFALLKAQAKEYVRQSQARLILQPIAERLLKGREPTVVAAQIQSMLSLLQKAQRQRGYAAGNLLNLLIHLGVDLAGYDFSHLCVWQADLRGVNGAALNFTEADLSRSVFTLTIDTQAVKFHPSGAIMVAGIIDGNFALWQIVDGQLTDALRSPSNGGHPMRFSEDGRLVAAAGLDYQIRVWSTADGACLQTLHGHTSTVFSLALSADGMRLASGTAKRLIHLWDMESGRLLDQLDGHEHGVGALTFSPDGTLLASGGTDRAIRIWRVGDGAHASQPLKTLHGHSLEIGALAFSPDGRLLASGDHGGAICLWDLQAKDSCLLNRQAHQNIIRTLLFHPDGQLLASGSADQTVRLWSLTGQLLHTLVGHTHEVETLSFNHDGQLLVSSGADQRVYLWHSHTGQALNSLQAYQHGVNSVCFSPDGTFLASVGTEPLIRLWPVAPKMTAVPEMSQHLRLVHGQQQQMRAVAISSKGGLLVSASTDQTVRLWAIATGKEVQRLHAHRGAVLTVAFSPDGALLASAGSDWIVRLWSVADDHTAKPYHRSELVGHQAEITSLAFSPRGAPGAQLLVTGGVDGTAHVWDVESGATRHILAGHPTRLSCVAISPDGETVATSGFDRTIRLWSLATGHCLLVHKEGQIGDHGIAFSPDGEWLAYGGSDFAVYLWRWRSSEPPYALHRHTNVVRALAFSPTAPLLVSCSDDSTLRLWDLTTKSCRQILRVPGPYAGMKIGGVTGISDAQKEALKALGADNQP